MVHYNRMSTVNRSFLILFFPHNLVLLTKQQNNSAKPLKISKLFPWTHGKDLKFSFKIFLAAHAYDFLISILMEDVLVTIFLFPKYWQTKLPT